jgi:hypothetical protein
MMSLMKGFSFFSAGANRPLLPFVSRLGRWSDKGLPGVVFCDRDVRVDRFRDRRASGGL